MAELSKTIERFDPAGSIIFVGSGFSRDAKNIRNQCIPLASDLKLIFSEMLGLSEKDSDHDLRTLADEVGRRADLNLFRTLYELFTVRELTPSQSEILRQPWRRIYTTNYDDAIEFGQQKSGLGGQTFNLDDDKPRRLQDGSVIHLHGMIRRASEDRVLDQLVLNEKSYVRLHFDKSPWYDEFCRDLRTCQTCFFVGYSLKDHHIAALLLQDPTLRDKTFFITVDEKDLIFEKQVAPYGAVLPIGVNGFAQICKDLKRPEPLSDPHSLRSFRYFDPFKDKRTLAPPTSLEVLDLVTIGKINVHRLISTLPDTGYVVPRKRVVDEALTGLNSSRCLLVHSRLGNGKSVFLSILAFHLTQLGFKCFFCKTVRLVPQIELDLLRSFEKAVIFFDSYNVAMDLIGQFAELSNLKFVFAVRTGVQEVRWHEIRDRVPNPFSRISLNRLDSSDLADFRQLLDRAGLWSSSLNQALGECKEIRDVVVSLFENTDLSRRVNHELNPLFADQSFKSVFIVSHILKFVDHDAEPSFIRSITGKDAFAEIARFREVAIDFFSIDDDEPRVRSAIFSEYLIQNFFLTADLIVWIKEIVLAAVRRKRERRYQTVLGSLLQVTNLTEMLRRDPDVYVALEQDLFERLRHDADIQREPLFWLQYAILMMQKGDLGIAERLLSTAYERAAESSGFQTYQIDTLALALLLLAETHSTDTTRVRRFDQIVQKLELIRSMIGNESHRFHAIEVLRGIEPFISARKHALSAGEKTALTYHLRLISASLEGLSVQIRAETGSDQIKNLLDRALQMIVAH